MQLTANFQVIVLKLGFEFDEFKESVAADEKDD